MITLADLAAEHPIGPPGAVSLTLKVSASIEGQVNRPAVGMMTDR